MTPEHKRAIERHAAWARGEEGGERAKLCWANLQGEDLAGVDLHSADLRRANLRGANLQGANLQGVDLRMTNTLWARM